MTERSSAPGFLVAVEGIDGAGKSTLLKELVRFCGLQGWRSCLSREPTDGPWGSALRESARAGRLPLAEELDLFCRDRAEHVQQVINPALAAGEIVLLDRYYYSTAAYQGARGADPAAIIRHNEEFAPRPDLVLLMDVEPTTGLGRVRQRGDLPDAFERLEELRAARRIFLEMAAMDHFVRVDAALGPEEVTRLCTAALAKTFSA